MKKIMKRLLVSVMSLLFIVEAAHALDLNNCAYHPNAPECVQQRQQRVRDIVARRHILQQQQKNPLVCRFVIREGMGWCQVNPTGLSNYVAGGPCSCGAVKLRAPFNETYLGPNNGTLVRAQGATSGFEFFARYGCDDHAKAYRGRC